MIPKIMQAALLLGHGGLDQLTVRDDHPVPVPAAGEVLIQVGAAAINNTDINTRTAWYSKAVGDNGSADGGGGERAADGTWSGRALEFPRIQGADVCGEIAAVGEGVDAARIGERVLIEPCQKDPAAADPFAARYFGSELDGGFARFTKVAASYAHRIDSQLDDAELASFPCAYSTAENMLERAGVAKGERVLVTGASGGVGAAAVQLACRRGARVTAVAGAAKSHAVFNLGADSVIPRGSCLTDALGSNSIDVVIDLVGGPGWPDLIEVLRPGGRYAVAGAVGGPFVALDLRQLYLKDLSFFGCTVLADPVFANLIDYVERGKIEPLVAETFPLADIAVAQEAFLARKRLGKIILIPNP